MRPLYMHGDPIQALIVLLVAARHRVGTGLRNLLDRNLLMPLSATRVGLSRWECRASHDLARNLGNVCETARNMGLLSASSFRSNIRSSCVSASYLRGKWRFSSNFIRCLILGELVLNECL